MEFLRIALLQNCMKRNPFQSAAALPLLTKRKEDFITHRRKAVSIKHQRMQQLPERKRLEHPASPP